MVSEMEVVMVYCIYEIRNRINGKIYIGVHKTNDLEDEYMGSGVILKRAISKYGVENFEKKIIETFVDAKSAYEREKEIVDADFLKRCDTYNLNCGGHGGFDYIVKNKLYGFSNREVAVNAARRKNSLFPGGNGGQKYKERYQSDETLRSCVAKNFKKGGEFANNEIARMKRKETLKKIHHQQGTKNSQYGSCWVHHNLIGSRKIKAELLPLFIEQGWEKGRRM